jgi:hypothetical protein
MPCGRRCGTRLTASQMCRASPHARTGRQPLTTETGVGGTRSVAWPATGAADEMWLGLRRTAYGELDADAFQRLCQMRVYLTICAKRPAASDYETQRGRRSTAKRGRPHGAASAVRVELWNQERPGHDHGWLGLLSPEISMSELAATGSADFDCAPQAYPAGSDSGLRRPIVGRARR